MIAPRYGAWSRLCSSCWPCLEVLVSIAANSCSGRVATGRSLAATGGQPITVRSQDPKTRIASTMSCRVP